LIHHRLSGWAALFAATGLALAACSSATNSEPAATSRGESRAQSAQASPIADTAGAQVLNISTGDYYFKPEQVSLKAGPVTVTLFNDGPRRHTFYVRNLDDTDDIVKGDDRLVAGESETVTFTLPTAGRYKMYCAIPGHADRGEIGWLVVS
jgi:uncharacterized cupredoxin-like copper-binding protein